MHCRFLFSVLMVFDGYFAQVRSPLKVVKTLPIWLPISFSSLRQVLMEEPRIQIF